MRRLIISGQTLNVENINLIRPLDEDQCIVFMVGCSPIDGGFLLDISADELNEALDAMSADDEGDGNVLSLIDHIDRERERKLDS